MRRQQLGWLIIKNRVDYEIGKYIWVKYFGSNASVIHGDEKDEN